MVLQLGLAAGFREVQLGTGNTARSWLLSCWLTRVDGLAG
jgi:hypothetical protein